MTEEQVVAWLGRPTNSYSLPGQQFGGQRLPPTKRLVWGDLFGDHVSVTLQDDKVETGEGRIDGKPVTLSPGGANPPPKAGGDQAAGQALADGFRKVRSGMTEEQVVALLGQPTSSNSLPAQQLGDQRLPASKFLTWGRLSGDHVKLTLRDDKVTSGDAVINGQTVPLSRDP